MRLPLIIHDTDVAFCHTELLNANARGLKRSRSPEYQEIQSSGTPGDDGKFYLSHRVQLCSVQPHLSLVVSRCIMPRQDG